MAAQQYSGKRSGQQMQAKPTEEPRSKHKVSVIDDTSESDQQPGLNAIALAAYNHKRKEIENYVRAQKELSRRQNRKRRKISDDSSDSLVNSEEESISDSAEEQSKPRTKPSRAKIEKKDNGDKQQ
jgi:hypothetical protein